MDSTALATFLAVARQGSVAGPIDHPDLVTRRAFREELVLVTALGADTMSERLAQGRLTVITFRQGTTMSAFEQRLGTTELATAGTI